MHSTDYNINNPLKKIDLELQRTIDSWKMPTLQEVTQEEYDLIQIHDPNTFYIIKNSRDSRMYYGDMLIKNESIKNRYFLTVNKNNTYTIYMNNSNLPNNINLFPIATYNDPQVAINILSSYNRVGSHFNLDRNLYNLILNYIEKDISTHNFIVGILVAHGYQEDPRLQNVIQFIIGHDGHKRQKEFPEMLSNMIIGMRDLHPESLYPVYSNLYDLVVKYNFFSDIKYSNTELDLSDEISDIKTTMINCLKSLNRMSF